MSYSMHGQVQFQFGGEVSTHACKCSIPLNFAKNRKCEIAKVFFLGWGGVGWGGEKLK